MSDEAPRTLRALREELQRSFQNAEVAQRRQRRKRRTLATCAVVLVATPTALATRSVWDPSPDTEGVKAKREGAPSPILVRGAQDADRWRLTAFASLKRGVCLRFVLSSPSPNETLTCTPFGLQQIPPAAVISSPAHTYVFGRVPLNTEKVLVVAGAQQSQTKVVRALPQARTAIGEDIAVYVATLDSPAPAGRLRVSAYDRDGQRLSP